MTYAVSLKQIVEGTIKKQKRSPEFPRVASSISYEQLHLQTHGKEKETVALKMNV